MSRKRTLSPEERERRVVERARKATLLRMDEYRAVYGGIGRGSKARDDLLDEGEDAITIVQRGDNRALYNLGDGARWHTHRVPPT